jgi:Zn-dependent protease/CBS domain-containing protein
MLARGVFPAWHPSWPAATAWGTALAAAVLFLLSILLHELSHALAGKLVGITIRRITLFIFGGMSHMENEPPSWRSELVMALAGPLTSLVLGFVFLWLASLAAGAGALMDDPREAIASLSPLASLLLWLGPVNIVLGVFNLVPGFPLDGGRALRALMWAATGNLARATRWASLGGQGFAWLLIATGILMIFGMHLPVLGGGIVNGLWLALIGWFLNNAALASYRQLLVRESLEHVPVSRLMQTNLVSVSPDTKVSQLLDEILIPSGQRAFPVQQDGQLLGMVFLGDLHRLDRAEWQETPLARAMVPVSGLKAVEPGRDAMEALSILARERVNQLPVMDHGVLRGILRREDVLTWLAWHGKRG